jgi:V/A-type H+-transporting ATPase subunit D
MSVSFGKKILPTKLELIRVKRSLQFSKIVYKILEDKREILLKRIEEIMDEAIKAREGIWQPLTEAYDSLFDAYMKVGSTKLESIGITTPKQIEVDVDVRTILNVELPTLKMEMTEIGMTYGFMDTNHDLDKTTRMIRKILPVICKAAELENAIFSLATELEKSQRILNALEYVIIPNYEESIKYISSTLEEREREDFVRLKQVKRILERGRAH